MSKRSEDAAMKAYPKEEGKMYSTAFGTFEFDRNAAGRKGFQEGYEQAEKDLADAAAFSSGPDGFYYGKGYQQGKKDAEKHLGWHSVEECLPEMDEEVIVLKDILVEGGLKVGFGMIAFGHLVDTERCIDYNGWNIPGVKFWMPMPKIPNEK